MKFINYLTSIDGVGIFPMISFIIFFSFFLIMAYMIFKVDKKHLTHMENIPFEGEEKN